MKTVILNGISSADRADLERQLASLVGELGAAGHEVQSFRLRDLDIRDCVGCFACWVRTPGICIHRDEVPEILRAMVRADRVVYVSDFHLHHLSPATKGLIDRQIPLRRAFLQMGKNGRTAHLPRYDLKYRTLLLVENHPDLDDGDLLAMGAACGGHQDIFNGAFRLDLPAKDLHDAIVRN